MRYSKLLKIIFRLVIVTHILCVCVYVEVFWLFFIFSGKHLLLFLIKTIFFILYNYISILNFQHTWKTVIFNKRYSFQKPTQKLTTWLWFICNPPNKMGCTELEALTLGVPTINAWENWNPEAVSLSERHIFSLCNHSGLVKIGIGQSTETKRTQRNGDRWLTDR